MKNIEALTLGQLFEGPNEEELAYTSPFSTATKDILLGFNIVDKKAIIFLLFLSELFIQTYLTLSFSTKKTNNFLIL